MEQTNKYIPIKGYLNEAGQLTQLAGKRQKKKQALMLQYLKEKFNPSKKYTEQEVNTILNKFHIFEDPATLRRMMFGAKMLDRTLDGREYWIR